VVAIMRFSRVQFLSSYFIVLSVCGCADGRDEERSGRDGVITQSRRNTCGPAALAMLLVSKGIVVTAEELERRMQPGADGVSLTTIVTTAREYGVHLQPWRLRKDALDTLKTPAILWVDGDHFVVFDSLTQAGAHLRDPATGRVQESKQRLATRWDGTAAVLSPPP
jgi:ABC-type bacteriocin/lantibiotic exporter with double-glycine peptidase domain